MININMHICVQKWKFIVYTLNLLGTSLCTAPAICRMGFCKCWLLCVIRM